MGAFGASKLIVDDMNDRLERLYVRVQDLERKSGNVPENLIEDVNTSLRVAFGRIIDLEKTLKRMLEPAEEPKAEYDYSQPPITIVLKDLQRENEALRREAAHWRQESMNYNARLGAAERLLMRAHEQVERLSSRGPESDFP